jgi:adhesin transport system membrane fusion protein
VNKIDWQHYLKAFLQRCLVYKAQVQAWWIKKAPAEESLIDNSLQQEDFDYIADWKEATLYRRTPFATSLIYILLAFLLIGFIWAYFAEVDEITHAEGKVIPPTQVQVIQNLEGGILSEITVREGENVTKGQVLLRIDDTRFASSYREQYAQYIALLASVARLNAETDKQTLIKFPEELNDYPEITQREVELFESRLSALSDSIAILQDSYNLALQELELATPLVKEGVMSRIELLRLQRQANDLKGQLEEKRDAYEEEAQTELNQQLAKLESLKEALFSLQDRVKRTTVRSPVAGTIKTIHINTVGGIIQPGSDIIEIVPHEDFLLIEAKIKPKDIAFIKIEQPAKVKFTAYDFSIYGGLEGVVQYISADTITDEETKEKYYEVLVKTEKNYLGSEAKPLPIKVGMVTQVDIITGRKSILDYLLKPLLKAKQNALTER